MRLCRKVAILASMVVACLGLTTVAASAAGPAASLSRPLIPFHGNGPQVRPNGIPVTYSSDWSGYAALPKTAGQTFTSIVANYNVPSVACSNSPDTFSFHWIGLDGWADQTVEQDGISANCKGSTPHYNAWYEMYPANSHFESRSARVTLSNPPSPVSRPCQVRTLPERRHQQSGIRRGPDLPRLGL